MIWENWIWGLVAAFIIILIFYTFTPFINQLNTEAATNANFSHTTTNTSYHNLLGYVSNIWDLWPIAAMVVAFLLLFYFTGEDDD